MKLPVSFKDSKVCLRQEVMPGVLLGNAVVKSRDGKMFVGLVNVNESDIRIYQYKPEFRGETI